MKKTGRYATLAEALVAMESIRATSDRAVKPKRAYLCPLCGTYHLTSQDRRNKRDSRGRR